MSPYSFDPSCIAHPHSPLLHLQVFIPRYTLDLKRGVEKATAALRSEAGEEPQHPGAATESSDQQPSAAAIAKRLGVTERAVQAVHEVWHTRMASLDPGGSEDNPYEDVQLAKEMDRCAR